MRLAETETGKALHMKRKTAEMNARYERKNGKRVYRGKKNAEAKKARRAEAARARRAREHATSHDATTATDANFVHVNQCVVAKADGKGAVTRPKHIQL